MCGALLLSGCGGGGNADGIPPAANRSPIIASANGEQFALIGAPFDFDPTQGGGLFRDPDGDVLTYQVTLDSAPAGLTLSGVRITGTPTSACTCVVIVSATDGRGGSNVEIFNLRVMNNTPPEAVRPNANLAVSANAGIELRRHAGWHHVS